MAEHAHITSPLSRRRSLFAAASAVIIGSGITAGAAASVADFAEQSDAELIAACAHFNELDRQSRARLNAAKTVEEEEEEADRFRSHLFGADYHQDWPALTCVCTTPGSSFAAAVALAKTISLFDEGEIIAPKDDPDDYVTPRLLAALMQCLLGSA